MVYFIVFNFSFFFAHLIFLKFITHYLLHLLLCRNVERKKQVEKKKLKRNKNIKRKMNKNIHAFIEIKTKLTHVNHMKYIMFSKDNDENVIANNGTL